jgi:phosphoglycerate dehydrogenase-like enzyme
MKPGAILINVSRGAIVNGDALTAALTSRRLRGAGLDATWEEPLPDAHPLWTMPNAIVTPHVAGISPRFIERSVELCCDNLRRFLDGQPLVSVVDKAKGY